MNKVKRCRYGDMLFPAHDLIIGRSFEHYGEYSESEVALFRRLVSPQSIVVDVGANIGSHTIPLAQLVGPGGQVVAFEPQRALYLFLCANVLMNNLSNVVCYQAAAGATRSELKAPEIDYMAEHNFGGMTLLDDYSRVRSYSVTVLKIDELRLSGCRLLKIDVEGMERQVLEGATETIRAFRPFLYVEDDRPEQSAGLRQLLQALGYTLYFHRAPYFNAENIAGDPHNHFPGLVSLNLYCQPQEAPLPLCPEDFQMVKI
jgi:FkbM family methyltransferase